MAMVTDSGFYFGKRVLVTGGTGFLGRHLVKHLRGRGATVLVPASHTWDLTTPAGVEAMYLFAPHPDLVFHLAAFVGGIGANRARPYEFYTANVLMNTLVLDGAIRAKAGRFVAVGSVCAYPWIPPSFPFLESDLWYGYPEETNAPYGVAKRGLLVQCQQAAAQYHFDAIYLLPTNLYGPGDNYDPNTSHVIPALLRRLVEAKQAGAPEVTVWGDGSATRDFLYVEDAVTGLLRAAEGYHSTLPLNLGSGEETSISQLVARLVSLTGFGGVIQWDRSKPNGQPRRRLDITRAATLLGWKPQVTLSEGLAMTFQDFVLKGSETCRNLPS